MRSKNPLLKKSEISKIDLVKFMKGYLLLDDVLHNFFSTNAECYHLIRYFWFNAPGYRIPSPQEAVAFLASKNRSTVDDLDAEMGKLTEVKK